MILSYYWAQCVPMGQCRRLSVIRLYRASQNQWFLNILSNETLAIKLGLTEESRTTDFQLCIRFNLTGWHTVSNYKHIYYYLTDWEIKCRHISSWRGLYISLFQLAQWIQVSHSRGGNHWNWLYLKTFVMRSSSTFVGWTIFIGYTSLFTLLS